MDQVKVIKGLMSEPYLDSYQHFKEQWIKNQWVGTFQKNYLSKFNYYHCTFSSFAFLKQEETRLNFHWSKMLYINC